MADPAHPDHAERLEWAGGPLDPHRFDSHEADGAPGVAGLATAGLDLVDGIGASTRVEPHAGFGRCPLKRRWQIRALRPDPGLLPLQH